MTPDNPTPDSRYALPDYESQNERRFCIHPFAGTAWIERQEDDPHTLKRMALVASIRESRKPVEARRTGDDLPTGQGRMMPFVADNSVIASWFFESLATDYTEAALGRAVTENIHVPALWVPEFSNLIRKQVSTGRTNQSRATEIIQQVEALGITVNYIAVTPGESLSLALRYGITSHDASYLDLASRLGFPLATTSKALRLAALKAGIDLIQSKESNVPGLVFQELTAPSFPTRAKGTIGGRRFYFHAKRSHWKFLVGRYTRPHFALHGGYPEFSGTDFNVTKNIIEKCAIEYLAGTGQK